MSSQRATSLDSNREMQALRDEVLQHVPEVGMWSQRNFGEQKSHVTGATLGSICPLLGLMEEFGELETAEASDNSEERKDSVADILIFLCDFLFRTTEENGIRIHIDAEALPSGCGPLCHAVLKRHQGIRGFDDPVKYATEVGKAVSGILARLAQTYSPEACIANLRCTWDKVKQRDWTKNKASGGESPVTPQVATARTYDVGDMPEFVPHATDLDVVEDALRMALPGSDRRRIAEAGLSVVATLLRKNLDYGSSALKPPRFAPKVDASTAILVRMSDKVSRMESLAEREGKAAVDESFKDTVKDLSGYSILFDVSQQPK